MNLKNLRKLHRLPSYHIDKFDTAHKFRLKITRPGCEFDGIIYDPSDHAKIRKFVTRLYENAAISAFGDLRTLETRIDPKVRDAREIPADQFAVDPRLLREVRTAWAEHFAPTTVRVRPYKIHVYGPGGHFKSHRDSPEPGLVGTFLVGIGDTRGNHVKVGAFCIDSTEAFADPYTWVAFYPDIPHHVSKLPEHQYRAVIAFKIFSDEQHVPHEGSIRKYEQEEDAKALLSQIWRPYGIILEHRYHIGVLNLTGFDSVLYAAAKKLSNVQVHLLPVVIKASCYRNFGDEDESDFKSSIHPFTSAHADFVLNRGEDPSLTTMPWLKGLENVPFYAPAEKDEGPSIWESEREEDYVGNESEAARETSIYLAFALLFLDLESPTKPFTDATPESNRRKRGRNIGGRHGRLRVPPRGSSTRHGQHQ